MKTIIVLLALSITLFAQDYKVEDIEKKHGITVSKETEKPITGILNLYYKTGELEKEIPYKNGKVNGVEKGYYKTGELDTETPYKDGKKNGISKYYYQSGELSGETPYKDGKENGISKSYYKSGQQLNHIEFKDGKRDGITIVVPPIGKPFKITYKNGKAIRGVYYNDDNSINRQMTHSDFHRLNIPY